jgi:DNA polymerase-1
LRSSLAELRLEKLAVGKDGRNRTLLSPFSARTSRNQPSNAKFIFGPSVWIRSLIKPPPGFGLAYVDWRSQEIGVAAKLTGDLAMQAAYRGGDPYLSFGKQAGLLPLEATKTTHAPGRELCKQCFLATGYGQGEAGLAQRIGQSHSAARELLRAHRRTFRHFWSWSDAAVDRALLFGSVSTVFGWTLHVDENPNPRALRNFPVQANAAEMMRLGACLACERGLELCAPVHDAFLLCAPLDRLDDDVAKLEACMAEASRIVLDGFELDTEVSITRFPDRYMDPRGEEMWCKVTQLLQRSGKRRLCA